MDPCIWKQHIYALQENPWLIVIHQDGANARSAYLCKVKRLRRMLLCELLCAISASECVSLYAFYMSDGYAHNKKHLKGEIRVLFPCKLILIQSVDICAHRDGFPYRAALGRVRRQRGCEHRLRDRWMVEWQDGEIDYRRNGWMEWEKGG